MSAPRGPDLDLDLARRLSAFLDEVPNRASERAADLALAHARAHPRRRDPLRALRRDPMARPWFGGSPVGRSLVLIAVLAALLVVSFAFATLGGLPTTPVVVPPVSTPSPQASAVASASPISGRSGQPMTRRLDLIERTGADALIEVTDESFTLVDAVSGEPADGSSIVAGTVAVAGVSGDAHRVQLTWTVGSCETLHQLMIGPDGRTMSLFQPPCEGDPKPRDLVLVLSFESPVDPAEVAVTLSVGE